ncbi:preprotein translocase subunit YajC [Paraoerskovia marina]|uniref:preprotein translocase subunit YajC n=1 Tax=Paraoerskovia marina TaxID=545619 RepID=UPI0004927CBF|nr:preprotein translocase subunit YajC [Paraoerskovia marina]
MDPLIIFAILAVGLLFLMSSRTRKQQRKQQEFRHSLVPGDDVMTASGLFGTVVEVDDVSDIITLETEPGGAQTRWLRAAIAKRLEGEEYENGEDEETDDEQPVVDLAKDDQSAADDVTIPDDLSGLSKDSSSGDDAPQRDEDDKTK